MNGILEPKILPLAIDKSGPIRRFTDRGIQEAVDRAMSNLAAEGKHVAAIAVANQDESGLALMARINEDWSIMAVIEKRWNSDGFDFEASVKWSV